MGPCLGQDYLGFSSSAWVPEAGACLIQELLPSWGIQKVRIRRGFGGKFSMGNMGNMGFDLGKVGT